ncbi:hypothetical protein TNCV_1788051 [Trichonephila clavipes]|nr:hypothetical protein TNCV_1788051 [Trichonephila clavipes]
MTADLSSDDVSKPRVFWFPFPSYCFPGVYFLNGLHRERLNRKMEKLFQTVEECPEPQKAEITGPEDGVDEGVVPIDFGYYVLCQMWATWFG